MMDAEAVRVFDCQISGTSKRPGHDCTAAFGPEQRTICGAVQQRLMVLIDHQGQTLVEWFVPLYRETGI